MNLVKDYQKGEELKKMFEENELKILTLLNTDFNLVKVMIAQWLTNKGLSTRSCAYLLNVSATSVSNYLKEVPKFYFTMKRLMKLLRIDEKLFIPLDQLGLQTVKSANNLIDGVPRVSVMDSAAKPSTIYNSPSISPLLPSHEAKTNVEQAPISNSSPPMTVQKEAAEQQQDTQEPQVLQQPEQEEQVNVSEQLPKPKRWVPI